MKELRPAVAIEKEIFITVVVVVAPDGTHRDTGLTTVDVGKAD
jgi:hypothetical protein